MDDYYSVSLLRFLTHRSQGTAREHISNGRFPSVLENRRKICVLARNPGKGCNARLYDMQNITSIGARGGENLGCGDDVWFMMGSFGIVHHG